MKHIWSKLMIFFIISGSCLSQQAQAQVTSTSVAPDFAAIDAYVQREMEAIKIPGLALGIVYGDEIVHLKGFGTADSSGRPVTPQTPFNLGSVAKTFTALAIMQQVEAGIIELDAPVQRYLPWFRVADPEAAAQITIYHLLNHLSGLPPSAGNDYSEKEDTSTEALENRVRALANVSLNRSVGTSFEYSNANYDVLGLIIQVVSGQTYESYVQEHIFAPLAMEHSFLSRAEAEPYGLATGYRMWWGLPVPFTESAPQSHRPSGQHFSTAEDMTHLLSAYLSDGRYDGRAILSPEGIHTMQNSPIPSGSGCATYSMHWSHGADCNASAIGLGGDTANFKTRALLALDDQWAVIILMNAQAVSINGPRQENLKNGVYSLLLGQEPAAVPPHNTPLVLGHSLIAGVTLLFIIGLGRSIKTLWLLPQLRQVNPHNHRQAGWQRYIPIALVAFWLILLAGVIQFTTGTLSSQPLRFMLENSPDSGWLIVISAILALAWGKIRTLSTASIFNRS